MLIKAITCSYTLLYSFFRRHAVSRHGDSETQSKQSEDGSAGMTEVKVDTAKEEVLIFFSKYLCFSKVFKCLSLSIINLT